MNGIEKKKSSSSAGFTLVELMVTMVISGFIIAGIYSAYTVQQKTYSVQETVAEMQQNIRAALLMMAKDFRMAGFRGDGTSLATFTAARTDAVAFTADLNEDDDLNDNVDSLPPSTDKKDTGENIGYDLYGLSNGVWTLGRLGTYQQLSATETPAGSGHYEVSGTTVFHQPLAENIEAIEFNYILANGISTTDATASGDLDNIRAVQISILARAGDPDRKFTNTKTYTSASGASWGPYNDNYRRRLLITTVQCRNMGLN